MFAPLLLLLLNLSLTSAKVFQKSTKHNYHNTLRRVPAPSITSSNSSVYPVAQYVELPINHFSNTSGTFMNRFWVDDIYYKPGGPIIFCDNGESSAEGEQLTLRDGAEGNIAKSFNGLLILWEHRFYGESMPAMDASMQFGADEQAQYYKYLTIEQALEDVAVFARGFEWGGAAGVDLKPGNTPWVFIGGSYPGARAAWARARNPEIWHASLASSAVVQLQREMWEYFVPIENTLLNEGYANCSADMRAMARWVDDKWEKMDFDALNMFLANVTGEEGSLVWRYFHNDDSDAPEDEEWNLRENLRIALAVYANFQGNGLDGGLAAFCDGLQEGAIAAGGTTNSSGVFAEFASEPEVAVGMYGYTLGWYWNWTIPQEETVIPEPGFNAWGFSDDHVYDCGGVDKAYCMSEITNSSWAWQVCSEFGAFHTQKKSRPESLLPYTLESFEIIAEDCVSWFGNAVAAGPGAAIDAVNKKYGGWNMNPSNVLWTDGELDPWRALSPNSVVSGAPMKPRTTVVPKSGETPAGGALFAVVVDDAVHCPDLGWDWQGRGKDAHALFIKALDAWLPAFVKHDAEESDVVGVAATLGVDKRLAVAVVAVVGVFMAL